METRERKKIYITHGAEYRAVEECIYEENLLFGDIYAQARDCLEEIIKISEQMQNNEASHRSDFCAPYEEPYACGKRKPENIVRRRSSNLIAFCAERGGGKTSAMISFVRALENLRRSPNKAGQKDKFWQGKKAREYHYELLPSIDPTSMELDDSILKMVLAHMYAKFQEKIEAEGAAGAYSGKQEAGREELIREFLHCFHFANRLNYKIKQPVPVDLEDELEYIEDKECGDTFRVQLYKLFEDYLQYMAPNQKAMLVIPIDDADVNTARVYDLLEDVRKYLQMPKVVVMMAANMTQLESTVEQHFLKQYETSLKYNDSMVNVERCHGIAEFYLKKIVSSTRQLNLPSLGEELQYSEGNVEIIYRDKNDPGKNLVAVPEREGEPGKEEHWDGGIYQEQLLGLLHRKTGLFFVSPKGYLHDFLPTGMRELTHFLAFLCDMPDVKATYDTIVDQVMHPTAEQKNSLRAWQKNLKQLQHYLVNIWSATNLRTSSKMLLRELINQPEENKNEYLLRLLPGYYGGERVAYNIFLGIATEEETVYSENFVSRNVQAGVYEDYSWKGNMDTKSDATYADVMAALRILTNSQGGNRQYKLAYAVRLYYTIYLHTILLKDCCVERPYDPEAFGKGEPVFCITGFLRDGLYKYTPNGDASLNSAFWHLPVNANALFRKLSAAERMELQENTQQKAAKGGSLKQDDKDQNETVYQSSYSFVATWFRVWEQKENCAKSRLVDGKSIQDTTTLMLHPFYPLFAEMDALTSRQIGTSGVQVEYEPGRDGRKRLLFSMMILLNTDVQQYLLHEYKERKGAETESEDIDTRKIFTSVFEGKTMGWLFARANGVDCALNEQKDEQFPDIWQMDQKSKACLAALSIIPGLENIYLKYLIQQIHKVQGNLFAAQSSKVTMGELEIAAKTPTDSAERKEIYSMVAEEEAQKIFQHLPAIKDELENLLDSLLKIDEDLLRKLCSQYSFSGDATRYKELVGHDVFAYDVKEGYRYLRCPVREIWELLEKYKAILKAGCGAPDKEAPAKADEKEGAVPVPTSAPAKADEKAQAAPAKAPDAPQEEKAPYDTYREIFRALFDELQSRQIYIGQAPQEGGPDEEA